MGKKKTFVHNIILVNEMKSVKLYEEFKDIVYEKAQYYIEDFDFDCDLTIYFKDTKKQNVSIDGEVEDARMTLIKRKPAIVIFSQALKDARQHKGGLFYTLFHEFAHIYDYCKTMNNKYGKANPMLKKQRTRKDFVISRGWEIWTEFYAYYLALKRYGKKFNGQTLMSFMKWYKNLKEKHKEFDKKLDEGNKVSSFKKEVEDYVESAERFVYHAARFMGARVAGLVRRYNYSEKTEEQEDFQDVVTFFDELGEKLCLMIKNPYGKTMDKKLFEIGKCVYEYFYFKLDISFVREDGIYKKLVGFQ